jgi:alkylation response protein AidB-like acyl-CoA dehydrogenase
MDISFSKEEIQFGENVRGWIRETYPADLKRRLEMSPEERLPREDHIAWHKQLHAKGWLAPHWPKEFGGQPSWSMNQLFIFRRTMIEENVPDFAGAGVELLGPVLLHYASEEQKRRFIPDILSADAWWCQGYSEPGAGSDLAALKTTAMRRGDKYIVNGSKIWTTAAHKADWIFCLVRTSKEPKRQQGISFLLIDMRTPGVTVRPILTIDGYPEGHHEVNEVFFDEVEVPVENLIGEEGQGWVYAKYLLEFERANPIVPKLKRRFKKLKQVAARHSSPQAQLHSCSHSDSSSVMIDDPVFRHKLAELEVSILAMEFFELQIFSQTKSGQSPGPGVSTLKEASSTYDQKIDELLLEVLGPAAAPFWLMCDQSRWADSPVPDYAVMAAPTYFNGRKKSIYGGTNEIQRSIIARGVLGLP